MQVDYSGKKEWETIHGVIQSISYELYESTGCTDKEIDLIRVVTDQGTWLFRGYGDCCTQIHIDAPLHEEMEAMVGQRVMSAEVVSEHDRQINDYDEAHDIHWYKLQGDKSNLTIVLHAHHNGYYGGSLEPVRED